jgi:hypothetical protein
MLNKLSGSGLPGLGLRWDEVEAYRRGTIFVAVVCVRRDVRRRRQRDDMMTCRRICDGVARHIQMSRCSQDFGRSQGWVLRQLRPREPRRVWVASCYESRKVTCNPPAEHYSFLISKETFAWTA